ncbi:uncharacterized protein LOC119113091 [Pollicipes pollicipes]|uniref:uncharacterized protein LOC119113091 n=1 Tax=Pollicipes pollicipes TaxID=41117 RepID=UPI0018853FFE|nr:uncharacterized protein LOC119113091 [Pollicipes pollicipes]
MERLWLYEAAVTRGVSQLLLRSAAVLPARLVRWDFPYRLDSPAAQLTAADLLRRDCLVRTSGHVSHVAALNVTQLLVPRRHDTVHEMVRAMEEQMQRPGAAAFSLSQEVFCTDAADGPYARKAPFLTLSSKTSLRPSRTERGAVCLLRPEAVTDPFDAAAWASLGRPPQLNPLMAAVQLYVECGTPAAGNTSFEGAAVRFKTRLVHSPVFVHYRQLRDASVMQRAGPRGGTNAAPSAGALGPASD